MSLGLVEPNPILEPTHNLLVIQFVPVPVTAVPLTPTVPVVKFSKIALIPLTVWFVAVGKVQVIAPCNA